MTTLFGLLHVPTGNFMAWFDAAIDAERAFESLGDDQEEFEIVEFDAEGMPLCDRINLTELRELAAEAVAMSGPGSVLMRRRVGERVLVLIDAVEAARIVHPGDDWERCDDPNCDECALRDKLAHFDFGDAK